MPSLTRRILVTELGLLVASALIWLVQWLIEGHSTSLVGTGIGLFIGGNLVGAWSLWTGHRSKILTLSNSEAEPEGISREI